MHRHALLFPLLFPLLLLPCLALQAGEAIAVAGSSAMKPLMDHCAKAFRSSHAEVAITVASGGPTIGIQKLLAGQVQIATVSRELKPEEAAAGLVAALVARDGLVFVVNAANPATALTSQQVQGIYAGRIASWKALGGEDVPIEPVTMREGYAARDFFLQAFGLEDRPGEAGVAHRLGKEGEFGTVLAKATNAHVETLAQLIQAKAAIGYVSTGTALGAIAKGAPLKALTLDGVEATNATIAAGTYKLRRPLTLVTKGPPTGAVKDFLAFVAGEEGQKLAAELELIPATQK